MAFARAVQGSNSIEGYNASLDDVVAAVEDEPILNAEQETQLALTGYRDAMTYVLQIADDASLEVDEGLLKSLHFTMIHPFRDGNGRMARYLQTLVLARDRVVAPVFSSIEEFLGRNTQAYYRVLEEWEPAPGIRTGTRAPGCTSACGPTTSRRPPRCDAGKRSSGCGSAACSSRNRGAYPNAARLDCST